MESIDDVLQKLKDGEVVTLCDIYSAVSLEGKKGGEMRLAALLAWVTNAAGSDSADALLLEIKNLLTTIDQDTGLLSGLIDSGRLKVSSVVTSAPTTAVTNASLDSLAALIVGSRLQVEVLGMLGTSRSVAAGSASAEVTLTTTCRRVRVTAVGADICFRAGTGSIGSAVTTDHYMVSGTSADFAVEANSKIAAIRAGSTDGSLRITELLPTV